MIINQLRKGIFALILVCCSHSVLGLPNSVGTPGKFIVVTSINQESIYRQLVTRPDSGYVGGGAIGAALSYTIYSIGNSIKDQGKHQRGMGPYQNMLQDYNIRDSVHSSLVRDLSERGYEVVESHQQTDFSSAGFSAKDYLTEKEDVGLIHVSFDYYFGPFLNTITINGFLEAYIEKKREKKTLKKKYSRKKLKVHYQVPRRVVRYVPLSENEMKHKISETYERYDAELKLTKKGSKIIRLRKKRDKEIKSYKRKYAVKSDSSMAREAWSKENLLSEMDKGFSHTLTMLIEALTKLNAKERFSGEEQKMPYTVQTQNGLVVGMPINTTKLATSEGDTHNIFIAKKNEIYIVPKGEVFQR